MSDEILLSLAAIGAFGVGAQWLAWRLHFPSILLLLIAGFIAGPITGLVRPDDPNALGPILLPLVSLSVGLILFEGGLSLRISELREVGHAVRSLIIVGSIATWFLTTVAAHEFLGFDLGVAALFGAILTVTGPTVIVPLLRHIRPNVRVGSMLKWEGIVNDPIGAMLAVLVFEAIRSGSHQPAVFAIGILTTLVVGVGVGFFVAVVLILLLRHYLIPDFLHSPFSLMTAVVAFAAANHLQHEAGLLATTVMGLVLANQKIVSVKHIIEFKENVRVLLISTLFVVLAARLEMEDLKHFGLAEAGFIVVLLVVIRPAAILISTLRSTVRWKERLFLSWMAPRGVVAAAVTSVFALRLGEQGVEGAERLVPMIFLVIISTVTIYGLTAGPVARYLRVAHPNPQGLLIVSAHSWARDLARAVHSEGFRVLLVDTNWEHISAARLGGLSTFYGSALSEYALDEIELDGIGRVLALTSNDAVNTLTVLHFVEVFGRSGVYQLPLNEEELPRMQAVSASQRGRLLLGGDATYANLETRFASGAVVKKTRFSDTFTVKDYEERYEDRALRLFLITEANQLLIYTTDSQPTPKAGQTLIALVPDEDTPRAPDAAASTPS